MLPSYKKVQKLSIESLLVGTSLFVLTLIFACSSQELMRDSKEANRGAIEVDSQIQAIAERAIQAAVLRHGAEGAFAVVADPLSGRILAVANVDKRTNSKSSPFWSLSQPLRPASVMKPLILAAAIERGLTKGSDVYFCERGNYVWEGNRYEDWKPFDKLTAADSIVHSSNICSIKFAQKLGLKETQLALNEFGFGPKGTAETFPMAISGKVDFVASDPQSLNLASLVTGSGLVVTPIEVVSAFGAIANGGTLLKAQASSAKPEVIRRVLSTATAQEMRRILSDVVTRGTAREVQSKIYTLAGKTGTAQDSAFGPSISGGEANVASFAGFSPVDNPRVVIYVGVIRPTDGDGKVHGSEHAAPVFREIAEETLKQWHVAPDKI